MLQPRTVSLLLASLTTAIGFGSAVAADGNPKPPRVFDDAALEFFERDVRPLLAQRCFECHSEEVKNPKGGLRLDSRRAAIVGGDTGPAVVPRKPSQSLLIDAIHYGDLYQMPPKSKMSAAEIAVLTKWVELGVPWPDEGPAAVVAKSDFDLQQRQASHWCWQPVGDYRLPRVENQSWPRQPLDNFVLARLEKSGLAPAAPADRRTLVRRAYFDLLGLPPTPAEVEAFVNDPSPRAFEAVVDRLLESPHFGERWARHWMDLVRYAESYGHEFDYDIPHASEYRDYLIRALNADVPYNQFVKEHIAGDLLAEPRRHPSEEFNESIIGTGFWFLGEATHAPVDVGMDEAGRIDNQIDVMSKTFLGLTVACARCHDHKFDAIATKDYYSLAGFLKSSRRQQALLDPHGGITHLTQQLGDEKGRADSLLCDAVSPPDDTMQEMVAGYLQGVHQLLVDPDNPTVEAVAEKLGLDAELLERWRDALGEDVLSDVSHPLRPWLWLAKKRNMLTKSDIDTARTRLSAERKSAEGGEQQAPLFADFNDGTYDGWFTTGWAFGDSPTMPGQWDSLQRGLHSARAGVAHSGMMSERLRGVLRSPTFTISHEKIFYRIAAEDVQIRLIVDGYHMDVYNGLLFRNCSQTVNTDGKLVWHQQAGDPGRYIGHRAHLEIIDRGDGFAAVDEIRFGNTSPPPPRPSKLAERVLADSQITSLGQLTDAYSLAWRGALEKWRRGAADCDESALIDWTIQQQLLPMPQSLAAHLDDAGKALDELSRQLPAPREVLAMTDGTGENSPIYIRGNPKTLGPEVPRQLLTALGGSPTMSDRQGSGRLLLAERMVDPANPLTSRVIVNRLWHQIFGRGIVPSVDNFGLLGQPPTHPRLLDALAQQFIREGWSIKQCLRSLMLSSTYQMSSTPSAAGDEIDPNNRLLHRMRIRRLQGEAIRDSILAVSGQLDRQVYGESIPVHLTPFMQGRGRPAGGPLDGGGRRSIYTEVRRNFLSPMMLAFDTPIPFSTVGRRNVSNVPAQALIMMNDPFVAQQARVWARQLLSRKGTTVQERVEQMYLSAFARPPTANELASSISFLEQQGAELGLTPEVAKTDRRVWADLCHVIMNVKEFVFVN